MRQTLSIVCVFALAVTATSAAPQQPGIQLSIPTSTLELGESVDVQLICTNTAMPESPQSIVPDGLSLKLLNPTPSRNTLTQIINGRRSQKSTYTFPMQLIALKEGTYTLGPISVKAGNQTFETRPLTIIVRNTEVQSTENGDRFVFVEMRVQPRSLYVMQSYSATLTFGIRKVEIDGREYRMDLLRDVLDQRASQFSIFSGGNVTPTVRWLRDSYGQRHRYEIFTVAKDVRVDEVGTQQIGPVFLKVKYPTALRRGFFGRLEPTKVINQSARADAVTVEVKPAPLQDRPADYNGTIGQFTMNVKAKPTRVELGHPVTLTIAIRGNPLDGVAGPDLSKQPELLSRFDFTNDELVGDVEGRSRVFRRAVFPKQIGQQTIPSISWSYFDPTSERYVTLTGKPIPIVVDPPSASTTNIIVPDASSTDNGGESLTAIAGGLSPNYVDVDSLLAEQSSPFTLPWLTVLAAAPLIWLTTTLVTRHRNKLRCDVGFARKRRARNLALTRINTALRLADTNAQITQLASAFTAYLTDRFHLPGDTLTPAEAREVLDSHPIDEQLADNVVLFLEACDALRYAPGAMGTRSPEQVASDLREWIKSIEGATS